MSQTKRKTATKTAKRSTAAKTHKKTASRTNCKKSCQPITNAERMHVCIVTVLSITAAILLCLDAAIMAVA